MTFQQAEDIINEQAIALETADIESDFMQTIEETESIEAMLSRIV